MKTQIITSKNFHTSLWSGGSTTQLYIYPADATYLKKDFELRLSTAKVEVKESNFTSLPGIYRKLMILEGEITIQHEDHYKKKLKPYDVDTFSGDWNTSSIGTCIDFNVMTSEPQNNELYHLVYHPTSNSELKLKSNCKKLFLYVTFGNAEIRILNGTYLLEKGSLMLVEEIEFSSLWMEGDLDFGLVLLEIL